MNQRARDRDRIPEDGYAKLLDLAPVACAVTRGSTHELVYANAAFLKLTGVTEDYPGRPLTEIIETREERGLATILDRAFATMAHIQDRLVEPAAEHSTPLMCTVWPIVGEQAKASELIVELRAASSNDTAMALQKGIAEQMLLSSVRERDLADTAHAAQQRTAFLADSSRRLFESLEEQPTLEAVTGLALPRLGDWCIVDLAESGSMKRLAVVNADARKQDTLSKLVGRWLPHSDDPFGLPAMSKSVQPKIIAENIDQALASGTDDPEVLSLLRTLKAGPLLTVPLMAGKAVLGAITFVAGRSDYVYTADDVDLAQELAMRAAQAIDKMRLHTEALTLKTKAETANRAKSTFLANMSHELRTPLNAIAGYVDIIDLGLHGPVTDAQRSDLDRIRSSQEHLLVLINDILNFVHVGSGRVTYKIGDVVVEKTVIDSVKLVEPLLEQKQLHTTIIPCDSGALARADGDKVQQIMLNLLANAIKFTPDGGSIAVDCVTADNFVMIAVSDTGIGIPQNQLETIFEPFAQVRNTYTQRDGGVGLGLAISRDLARAMDGNLIAQSTLGEGSRFTLSLPRAESK